MSLFFGGIPTRPDVEKLMRLDPQPGMSVSYEKIAEIIGVSPKESRFNTVLSAWRRHVFRERFIESAREGEAVHFLTPDQAQDAAYRRFGALGRAAGRHRVKVEAIDSKGLSGERKDKHFLLKREAQAMHEAAQKAAKEIALPEAVKNQTLRLAASK